MKKAIIIILILQHIFYKGEEHHLNNWTESEKEHLLLLMEISKGLCSPLRSFLTKHWCQIQEDQNSTETQKYNMLSWDIEFSIKQIIRGKMNIDPINKQKFKSLINIALYYVNHEKLDLADELNSFTDDIIKILD